MFCSKHTVFLFGRYSSMHLLHGVHIMNVIRTRLSLYSDIVRNISVVRVTSGDVAGGVADRDPQNIWNPQKNCGSFDLS